MATFWDYTVTDTLLIDFTIPDTSIAWTRFSNGVQQDKGVVESLNELIEIADKQQIFVWLSAENITLNSISVPSGQQRHLQRILPGLLEDSLASDIEELHFIHGGVLEDGVVNVAIIDRELIKTYLGLFNEAGLTPHAMLPDSLSVAINGDAPSLQVNGDLSQLRISPQIAYVFDTDNMVQLLQLMLKDTLQPLSLYIIDSQRNSLAITSPFEWQGEPTDKLSQLPDKSVMAMNLLQGEFTPQSDFKKHWLQWRSVAILAIGALVIQLSTVGIETWQLNGQVKEYKLEIKSAFNSVFPDVTRIVNPKAQMSQQLSRLQSQQGGMGFLMLLQQVSPIINQSKNVKLTKINFEHRLGEMRLDVEAPDYAQLERVKNKLEQLGFNINLGAVSANKGAYTTRLTIKGQR